MTSRVVVAGAGAAGLEALLAVWELAGERVDLTLLTPERSFVYRPVPTARPFALGPRKELSLVELADELDMGLVEDELAVVDDERGTLLTRAGETLHFDALVVAVGARQFAPFPHALAWHDDGRGSEGFGEVLEELKTGAAQSAAFVVPPDAGWPVPAYELALMASASARLAGREPRLFLATAEEAPLAELGADASRVAADRLEEAHVELLTEAWVEPPPPPASERGADFLTLLFRRAAPRRPAPRLHWDGRSRELHDERLVSVMGVHGRFLPGLSHDSHGFLPVDEHARVQGARSVCAAGDVTSVTLKHSLVAAAQAGAAARSVAAALGAPVEARPWEPLLHGIILDGPPLQAREIAFVDDPATSTLWWPPGRVTGPALARFLAKRDRAVKPGLGWHPRGLAVSAALRQGHGAEQWMPPHLDPDTLIVDAADRSEQALQRAERESRVLARAAGDPLDRFEQREHEVIARLEAAGYLSHDADAAR